AIDASVVPVSTNSAPGAPFTPRDVRSFHIDGAAGAAGDALAVTDGALWTVGDRRVLRIDPGTGQVVATVDLGDDFPLSIGAAEGGLYVLGEGDRLSRLVLTRIDPSSNRVVYRVPVYTDPGGLLGSSGQRSRLAVGAGAVWVSRGDHTELLRIDPRSGRVVATIPLRDYVVDLAATSTDVWLGGEAGLVRVKP